MKKLNITYSASNGYGITAIGSLQGRSTKLWNGSGKRGVESEL